MAKFRIASTALCAISLSLVAAAAPGAANELDEARAALQAELPGTLIHNPYLIDWTKFGADVSTSNISTEGVPGNQAYRVRVKKAQQDNWRASIRAPIDTPVKEGDRIEAYFWVRTAQSSTDNGLGDVQVSLGRNQAPYDSVFSRSFTPSTEWTLLTVDGVARADFPIDQTRFTFNLGNARQTLEFGQYYIMRVNDQQAAAPAPAPAPSAPAPAAGGIFLSPASLNLVGAAATSRRLADSEAPSGNAFEVSVTNPEDVAWRTFVSAPLNTAVSEGDNLTLRFWVRSVDGPGQVTAVVKQKTAPFKNAIRQTIEVGEGWQQFEISGQSKVDIPLNGGAISFMVGDRMQTIQFSEYQLARSGN